MPTISIPTERVQPIGTYTLERLLTGLLLNTLAFTWRNDFVHTHISDDATQQQIDDATSILDGCNALALTVSKTSILADDTDEAVVTCPELGLSFDYSTWVNGVAGESGSVADGSMEYTSNVAGEHLIEIREPGTNNTGYATITVVEVV